MPKPKLDRMSVIMIALAHGATDLYANFTSALLPFFENKFSLSKTSIGLIITVIGLSGSMFQFLYGYMGDRWGRRLFVVWGPAISAVFMSMIGLSPNFGILLLLLVLGGMGVSAFHPHAASSVGDNLPDRRDVALAVFMGAGTIGYALGPPFSVWLITSKHVGPYKMPLASLIGITISFLLYMYVPSTKREVKIENKNNIAKVINTHMKLIILLCFIVVLRSTTVIVYVNFLSLFIKQKGLSLMVGGWVLLLFSISTALGTFIGGYVTNRFSRKVVLIWSMALSFPFLLGVVFTEGSYFVIFLLVSGILVSLSNSANVAMAQEHVPEGSSTVSSIMMGVGWGIAAIFAMLFGFVADLFGGDVVPAMAMSSILPLLGVLLVLPLPDR